MKRMSATTRARRTGLWALGIVACLTAPLTQARDCGCGDLPTMIQELNEHEFLANVFQRYSDYTPSTILTIREMQTAARDQLNAAFYGEQAGASAGTTSGAHAALGTDVFDATCPILEYLYDSKGKALLNKDGTQRTRPVTEETFKTKQCRGRTRADFAHERSHVANCQKLVASGKTHLWDRLSFFAADDAQAYRAGAAVLREEVKSLTSKCGWDSSSKNRLPNVQEAQQLSERAAKARPKRRKKK